MNIKSRIAPLLLAGVVALGIATVPAVAADAAPSISTTQAKAKTGTLVVQLVTPAGKILKKRFGVLYGSRSEPLGGGTTSFKGKITFKKIKAGKSYIAVAYPSASYVTPFKTGITIKAGKTTTVRLKVAVGASISGTVLDPDGVPAAGVPVNALNKNGDVVGDAFTNESGVYKIAGLSSGSYTVAFNDNTFDDNNEAYTTSYWNNATDLASANFFKVTQQSKTKSASSSKLVDATLAAVPAP